MIVVLIERTKLLPICATATAPWPLPPVNVIVAVVLYPLPGVIILTATTRPALLITAVIWAGATQVPVTITSGGIVYPEPPLAIVTPCMPNR